MRELILERRVDLVAGHVPTGTEHGIRAPEVVQVVPGMPRPMGRPPLEQPANDGSRLGATLVPGREPGRRRHG